MTEIHLLINHIGHEPIENLIAELVAICDDKTALNHITAACLSDAFVGCDHEAQTELMLILFGALSYHGLWMTKNIPMARLDPRAHDVIRKRYYPAIIPPWYINLEAADCLALMKKYSACLSTNQPDIDACLGIKGAVADRLALYRWCFEHFLPSQAIVLLVRVIIDASLEPDEIWSLIDY